MKLTDMKNIGREMEKKLNAIGINSAEELLQTGAVEAYAQMKNKFSELCLVHLYALEAAISGINMKELSAETKAKLKTFCESMKK